MLGIWLLEQVLLFPESMKNAGGVAIAAHLGGFAGGFIMTLYSKKPDQIISGRTFPSFFSPSQENALINN